MSQHSNTQLLQDRVTFVYSNAVSANLTVLLVSGLFLFILKDSTVNQSGLYFWSSTLAFVALLRLLTWFYRKKHPTSLQLIPGR